MIKINKPCYFYNTGGCFNKDGSIKDDCDCKYNHIYIDKPLDKPQHLRPPCKFYHLNKKCYNIYCSFGHIPLLLHKWYKSYPNIPYPERYNEHIWYSDYNLSLMELEQLRRRILILILPQHG